jgi:hypothetical protein
MSVFIRGVVSGKITACHWHAAIWALLVDAAIGGGLVARGADTDDPVRVGLQKQLLVDDWVIATKKGLSRELGKATKANGGKPIFADGRFYGTVLHDHGRFKLWYRKHSNDGYGYAESADGEHFARNADLTGINFAGDFSLSVLIDPHESDPAHRYKAAYDGPGMAAALARSADGIHWTPYNNGQPVTGRAADTYNQVLWDEQAHTYRLFTRTDIGPGGGRGEIRGNRGMINPDVKTDPTGWRTIRSWAFDREGPNEHRRRQIYALTDWIHEGIHFALMTVYEWPGDLSEGPADYFKRHERNILNFYIATSRDGDSWDLSWIYAGRPLIPRGPDGSFDKDRVFPSSTVVTHDDRHWLYYYGADERHGTESFNPAERKFAIGLATLRQDGLVCLEASDGPGMMVTKPFTLAGNRLELNADASRGQVVVEVLDQAGSPIPGFTRGEASVIQGVDGLRVQPQWSSARPFAGLKGTIIRLSLHLEEARVYAFQICP